MPFIIVLQDITKMETDAIVNAADTELQMGGGVSGAIFKAAGASDMQVACGKLAPIQTGDAVITPGFKLPAKSVIHTAGPIYRGGENAEEEQLRLCYLNSLERALENKCNSIAFPLISSGIYGYPKEEALQVATGAIREFLKEHDLEVYLTLIDKETFVVSEERLGEVASYINEHYIVSVDEQIPIRDEFFDFNRAVLEESELISDKSLGYRKFSTAYLFIGDLISNLAEPFSQALLRLIDAKGKTDVEVYKRANLDRRLFSKIRTGKSRPSRRTAIALAVALELSLEETDDLLQRAGYALSHSQVFDVIVEYFIINGNYDIFEINEVLFKFDQPLLGS